MALNMISGVGPAAFRKLLKFFREPAEILHSTASKLETVPGVSRELARQIAAWQDHVDLPAELDRVRDAGVDVVTQRSELYPALLRAIHDPPILLYCWGALSPLDSRAIGMVGSRKTSYYGLETAKKLSYHLAYAGLTVVSGLARGIDTACHQGALAAKGRTVAVLGCGLSEVYPPENYALAERIADGWGAVVSEFPMALKPDKRTFPMRNRIISGFSMGLLVVEAGLNSGALISAGQALDQGRTVFAVPGQIDRVTSQGSNRLIQQGAKLVMDAADVIEEMSDLPGLLPVEATTHEARAESEVAALPASVLPLALAAAKTAASPLKPDEAAVYAVVDTSETPIDQIITMSGLPTSVVSSTLFVLELKKLVRQLPGKHFVKVA